MGATATTPAHHPTPPLFAAVPSALRELLAAASPATSTGAQATPGAMGPQAPAPTPVTGGRLPAAGEVGLAVNAATLAAKLAEMAEEHDVTLEVPAVCRSGRRGGGGGLCIAARL